MDNDLTGGHCKAEMLKLEIFFKRALFESNKLSMILYDYVASKSKRIRSSILFLLLKSVGVAVGQSSVEVAGITELVHNASLIHDDVIDDALERRGKTSLNAEYDNKLAVLAGDYILSVVMKRLLGLKIPELLDNFVDCLKEMVESESKQYFSRFEQVTINDYLEKTREKTARLFAVGIENALIVEDRKDLSAKFREFALNFGTAFQIKNDMENLEEDFRSGIYTAPLIYLSKQVGGIREKSFEEIVYLLKSSNSVEQSKALLHAHVERAIDIISFIEDNQYKKQIVYLCQLLEEVRI